MVCGMLQYADWQYRQAILSVYWVEPCLYRNGAGSEKVRAGTRALALSNPRCRRQLAEGSKTQRISDRFDLARDAHNSGVENPRAEPPKPAVFRGGKPVGSTAFGWPKTVRKRRLVSIGNRSGNFVGLPDRPFARGGWCQGSDQMNEGQDVMKQGWVKRQEAGQSRRALRRF